MTKWAAALLTAALIGMLSGFVANLLIHPQQIAQNAYPIATGEAEEAVVEARVEEEPVSVMALLAAAEVDAGLKVARKCTACHSFEEGGPNKIGPNLWNTLGRAIASVEGFAYSAALQDKAGEAWTYENLDAFLADPKGWAPGTKMAFAGLGKVADRANMIVYLRSLSSDPPPLPTVEETAEAAGETAETAMAEAEPSEAAVLEAAVGAPATAAMADGAEAADSVVAMIVGAEVDDGKKVARKCAACHTFEEGGANKIGPNLWDILGRAVASVDGFKYSDALEAKSGESWSYESMNAFLAQPKDWAPGTKMAFAGLRKDADRASIIAYMRSLSGSPMPLPAAQ